MQLSDNTAYQLDPVSQWHEILQLNWIWKTALSFIQQSKGQPALKARTIIKVYYYYYYYYYYQLSDKMIFMYYIIWKWKFLSQIGPFSEGKKAKPVTIYSKTI